MAQDRIITQYITLPDEVAAVRNDSAKIGAKSVLPIDDLRIATQRIFRTLSGNPELALVSGLGLAIKGSHQQYRKLSVADIRQLFLEKFVLVKPEAGANGQTRFRVLTDADQVPFFWPSVLQGRWITPEVESFFPEIKPPQAKLIRRP